MGNNAERKLRSVAEFGIEIAPAEFYERPVREKIVTAHLYTRTKWVSTNTEGRSGGVE